MPVPVGRFRKVSDLIHFFVLNGCVLKELPGHVEGPDGDVPVRYPYNPTNDQFVSLSNLDNDDSVAPSTYENWGRRLGIPFPDLF